jgi:hypothetical protein
MAEVTPEAQDSEEAMEVQDSVEAMEVQDLEAVHTEVASHTEVAHLMAVEAQDGPSQFLQDGAQVAQEAMDQEVAMEVGRVSTNQCLSATLPDSIQYRSILICSIIFRRWKRQVIWRRIIRRWLILWRWKLRMVQASFFRMELRWLRRLWIRRWLRIRWPW